MSRIDVDSTLGLGFDRVVGPTWVYDEHGNKLGQFTPYVDPLASCPYSEEELARRDAAARANPREGKTLEQIRREMGQ
jgi:hypothetical protein